MTTWKKVGENLVRHSGGTIYLRGRVAGKPIRVSLGTNDLRIAKIARDARLFAIRKAAVREDLPSARTLGAYLGVVEKRIILPHLKPKTVEYYRFSLDLLRRSMDTSTRAMVWTETDAAAWWRTFAPTVSAQCANHVLGLVKRMGDVMTECGAVGGNPASRLRRVPIRRSAIEVPSAHHLDRVIEEIRSQGLRCSEEVANMVAFLAFSGLRVGEAREVCWKDAHAEWLHVSGGEAGTKSGKFRRVPMNPALKAVFDRMKWGAGFTQECKLFSVSSPRGALRGACSRLKIDPIHPHMLRHYFATWAIEHGVDVPTVSKWLGHADGGALAMKTYGHIRDDHSARMASKLVQ